MTKALNTVIKTLQKHNYQAVLAGGCVRDLILGRTPNDYDIATNATPDQIESIFSHSIPIGKSFGVINVIQDGEEFEIATFRSDGQYFDGRHPSSVSFTNMKEDALRRDFTINGMFLDPISGEIYDYVGGEEDIKQKIIRFIGDPNERIKEDKLRILRAIRFAVKLPQFTIEENSFRAITASASLIHQVSAERIRDELIKIFKCNASRKSLHLLKESGLLKEILPEVDALYGLSQDPRWHPEGDAFTHTILVMEKLENKSDIIIWSALLHDIGKAPTQVVDDKGIHNHGHALVSAELTEAILLRLKFPSEFIKAVKFIVDRHMSLKDAPTMKRSTIKKYLAKPYFNELLTVCWADTAASHNNLSWYHFFVEKQEEYTPEQIRPTPLITGKDLIALGFKPGPQFKIILENIMDMQLNETIFTREEALNKIKILLEG